MNEVPLQSSYKPGYVAVGINSIATSLRGKADIHMLKFPATRSILWDHRHTGPTNIIHINHYRNPVILVEEKTLRILQRVTQESNSDTYRCLLFGSLTLDHDGCGLVITVDRLEMCHGEYDDKMTLSKLIPGDVSIPCVVRKNCAKPTPSVEHYENAISLLCARCATKSKIDVSHFIALRANCSYHSNNQKFIFHIDFDMVTSQLTFKASPVNPVPVVPTALSKHLTGPMGLSEIQGEPKCGYLSMDNTRKLLLVLDTDPKVNNLPLVGIWVSGLENVHDPFVWASCLRYLFNESLQERVCVPPEPFLIVLYSPLHTKPEFYECVPTGGKAELGFLLSSCHEVFQLSKEYLVHDDAPVEIELIKVEDGEKKDMFDRALQKTESIRLAAAKKSSVSDCNLSDNIDEITPRNKPAPHLNKAPVIKPSVPEVSLLLDDSEEGECPLEKSATKSKPEAVLIEGAPASHQNGGPAQAEPVQHGVYNLQPAAQPHYVQTSRVTQQNVQSLDMCKQGHHDQQPNVRFGFYSNAHSRQNPQMFSANNRGASQDQQLSYHPASHPGTHLGYHPGAYMGQCSASYPGQHMSSNPRQHPSAEIEQHPRASLPQQWHPGTNQGQYLRPNMGKHPGTNMKQHPGAIWQHRPEHHPTTYFNQHPGYSPIQAPGASCRPYFGDNPIRHFDPNAAKPMRANCAEPLVPFCHRQGINQSPCDGANFTPYSHPSGKTNPQPKPSYQDPKAGSYHCSGGQCEYQPAQSSAANHCINSGYRAVSLSAQDKDNQMMSTGQRDVSEGGSSNSNKYAVQHRAIKPASDVGQMHPHPESHEDPPMPFYKSKSQEDTNNAQRLGSVNRQFCAGSSSHQPTPLPSPGMPQVHSQSSDNTNCSPVQNSGSTDSGLHSNDSADSGSHSDQMLMSSFGPVPVEVYERLQQQDELLKSLQQQLAKLLAKESSSVHDASVNTQSDLSTTNSQDISAKERRSVAVNTSLMWPHLDKSANQDNNFLQRQQQDQANANSDTCQQVRDASTSPRHNQGSHRPPHYMSPTQQNNDSLSLGDFQLTQMHDGTEESMVSDMVVDLPDYTSLSPEKLGANTSGYQETDSNRSPMFGESVSMYDQPYDTGDIHKEICEPENVDLLANNQKQFYETLINNVQKLLAKHTEDADEQASSARAVPETETANNQREAQDKSIDIAELTRQRLKELGVELDNCDSSDTTTTFKSDQSFFINSVLLPKVNYMSMMFDSSESDLSHDANALAMKYLSDEQLSALALHRQTGSCQDKNKFSAGVVESLAQNVRRDSPDISLCGILSNQISFASRKYLERYGLLSTAGDTHGKTGEGEPVLRDHPALANVQQYLCKLNDRSLNRSTSTQHSDGANPSDVATDQRGAINKARYYSDGESFSSSRTSSTHSQPIAEDDDHRTKNAGNNNKQVKLLTEKRKFMVEHQQYPGSQRNSPLPYDRVLDIEMLKQLPKLL